MRDGRREDQARARLEWRNWAQIHSCAPEFIHHPTSEDEIQEVLKLATRRGRSVKVVGSGHSPNDIAMTSDHQIQLDQFNQLLFLDRKHCVVTVQAGMTLDRLNRILWENGMAISNLGSISEQTVAGALSTGTHGTGLEFGNLATSVLRLRVIQLPEDPDSECVAHECTREDNPDLFAAALCGLGVMGVITEVTLQCEPSFLLREEASPSTLPQVLDDLDQLCENNEHMRFFWYPHTDQVKVFTQNRVQSAAASVDGGSSSCAVLSNLLQYIPFAPCFEAGFRRWVLPLWEHGVGHHGLELCYWIALWFPVLVPYINRFWFAVFHGQRKLRVDRSFDVFNFDCLFKQHVNEWAIPRRHTAVALRRIEALIQERNFRVHFPVEVRFVAGDDQWLSPAEGRETCYIGIIMYRPFGSEPEYREYFAEFEAIMAELEGRPHWAKAFDMSAEELRQRYPRWDEFSRLRRMMDPNDLLMNEFSRRLFSD